MVSGLQPDTPGCENSYGDDELDGRWEDGAINHV